MNFSPKTNFKHEIKTRIKAKSKPELTSNIETIAKKVVSGKTDVQEDYKAKNGFNIKVEINDGELQNGLSILETLKCSNEVKEVTKSSSLLSNPQTPENSRFAHEMEIKLKDFKVKLKDELMDDEFQNGLRTMETMKCGGTENKVKNEIKLRPIASLLPKSSEINDNVDEVEEKPKEMKAKVEPNYEFETEELQNGLQIIETINPTTMDADVNQTQIRQCGHTLKKITNIIYKCPLCDKEFSAKETLKNHMIQDHKTEKKLMKQKCLMCTKKFNNCINWGDKDAHSTAHWYKITHLIEDHLVWRQKEKYLKCTLDSCREISSKKVKVEPRDEFEKEELQNGIQVIETMNPKTLDTDVRKNMIRPCGHTLKKPNMVHYQCPLCGIREFSSKKTLKEHMVKDHKHAKKLKKESCFKCGKKWYTKYGNRQSDYLREKFQKTHDCKIAHLLEVHLVMKEEEKCLKCLNDDKETSSKVHIRKKSKVVPMPALSKSPKDTTIFKCFGCKKILKTKELLDKHSHVHDRHLTHDAWFKCSICDAVFSTVVFLNQHVVFKHQENLKAV